MKKLVLCLALLLATSARSAMAQPPGVNLSWDDCSASLAGGLNKTSTCQSNTEAAKRFYGSYVLPTDAQALWGNDIVIDVFTNSGTLPCWWNFTVAPRSTAYEMRFDMPCSQAFDYWSTIPGGATGTVVPVLRPSTSSIRITATAFVDQAQAQPVLASVGEIYAFTFLLKFDATTGGTCTGCLTSACFWLQGIRVFQAGGRPTIEVFGNSSRRGILWQGGAVAPPGCFTKGDGVPARVTTWGMVKALYR